MNELIWELDNVKLLGRFSVEHLEIKSGITAVLGPSGAGKSSLLNMLVGFLPYDSGKIKAHHDSGLAWVPQNAGLWPQLTVQEHLDTASNGNKTNELLEIFDLFDKRDSHPAQLSGGEASRLSMARALATGHNCLVIDEPLVHVDRQNEERIWLYLRRLADVGYHIIFSSHSYERVLSEAQHVICLNKGKVIFNDAVEKLYHHAPNELLASYLGPCNWFDKEDSQLWLNDKQSQCLRPEQTDIQQDSKGPLRVESSRHYGHLIETTLHHISQDIKRRIQHISRGISNPIGSSVHIVKLFVLLMVISFTSSCGEDEEETLEFKSESHFNLPAAGKKVPAPRSVAMAEAKTLYILDNAGRVVKTQLDGKVLKQWNMPDSKVGNPEHIKLLKDGRLAVCDTHYHRIVFFNNEGKVLSMFGKHGQQHGEFIYPVALTEDDKGNLYVCEYGSNDRIQKFDRNGKWLATFGTFGSGAQEFQRPSGIVWKQGQLFIADAINNRILVFTDDGKFIRSMGDKKWLLNFPYDLTIDNEGMFWTAEYGGCRITRFTPDGKLLGRWGSAGQGSKGLRTPWSLAVSPAGSVIITDTGNHRITVLKR